MYGIENKYFNKKIEGFTNFIWTELIGFDNKKSDFGVSDYIKIMGFIPDGVSFHLTSIDFVNYHKGMNEEYPLPRFACSYFGHSYNDDREIQNWTNYQLKGLIAELHKNRIKVYSSFFDLQGESGFKDMPRFCDLHPELSVCDKDNNKYGFIFMLKRFSDGSYYEDFLLKKLVETAIDYKMDGFQLADGISCPRLSLQLADFSDDMIDQFINNTNIKLPDEFLMNCTEAFQVQKRAEWILENRYSDWVYFNTARQTAFMSKIIKGLRKNGIEAAFNSAWTKDPVEAIVRYGADYNEFYKAGGSSCIVEDVSSDLAILGEEDNGYHMDYKYRKFIHYQFAANLMFNKAYIPKLPLTPLFMLRDTLEQWDVVHHMPTSMQRAAATNLNNFYFDETGKLIPVTNGPHFCLSDGLKPDEWKDIRLTWDNGYTENPIGLPATTILFSEQHMKKEVDAVLKKNGFWHSSKWTAELQAKGAPLRIISNVDSIEKNKGPIIVYYPEFFNDNELSKILAYKDIILFISCEDCKKYGAVAFATNENNRVKICFSMRGDSIKEEAVQQFKSEDTEDFYGAMPYKMCELWTHPLWFQPVNEQFLIYCANKISEISQSPTVSEDNDACHVWEVKTGKNISRVFIENEEYFYSIPRITFERKIKIVNIITKPKGYPVRQTENSFKTRVPGRGCDIAEVEFEDTSI